MSIDKVADLYNTDSGQPVGDWGTLGQQPTVDTTPEHGVTLQDMVQKQPGTGRYMDANTIQQLEAQGYWNCPGKMRDGSPCDFWLNPQQRYNIEHSNGYFTCPRCNHSFDLMEELPSHGLTGAPQFSSESEFLAGGKTRIGLPLGDQGQIGENLVAQMGEIPGYGRITWWHPGGATSPSPLDGATDEWGIEVKTLGYDSIHHRFNPGGEGEEKRQNFETKNRAAAEMGLKGVLGILVLLDYRRDVADIYVKAMPLEPWEYRKGRYTQGVSTFRTNTATQLVKEVPFKNPFHDPHNPSPMQYNAKDYYERPEVQMPEHLQQPQEPAPF